MERVQKIIAQSGFCSRRKAEEYIKQGKVYVNGEKVNLGDKCNFEDLVEVDGNKLSREEKEYILLYKPRGIITSMKDEKGRKTVHDLIASSKRLYPVGRLDYDTSGLLLMTNDGQLANILMHPSNNIEKEYVVKIKGKVDPKKVKSLEKGIVIDGKKTSKAKVKIKSMNDKRTIIYITIHEGRNHEVKKLFESIGYKVDALKRERIAFLNLNGLKSGEYRYLNTKEVKKLYALKKD